MRNNIIVVVDCETSSNNEQTCELVQLGAVAINPRNLTVYAGGEFSSLMRLDHPDLLQPEAVRVHKKTREILEVAPPPQVVWHQFSEWCKQWNLKGKNDGYSGPIPAGHNIVNFDWPILCRYADRFGTTRLNTRNGVSYQSLFSNVWKYDVLQMMNGWTESLSEPDKLSLDFLRKYFDMPMSSRDNAHDALQDVRDTATILIKLLKLQREHAPKVIWKDSCNPEAVALEQERRKAEKQKAKEREADKKARGRK